MQKINRDWMILLLLIFTSSLFAQESNDTIIKNVTTQTPESKLLIDDGDGIIMSYAQANMVMTNKFFGLKERLNSQRWQGYYGTSRVTEPTFFEIAGFTEEAMISRKYQSIRQNVFWTGTGLAILGILIGSIQLAKDSLQWQWKSQGVGIGLIATGLVVDAVWYFSPPKRYYLGTALYAANKYNKRE